MLTESVAQIQSAEPIFEFHCPDCASTIILSDEGLAKSYCVQVVSVGDWLGERRYLERCSAPWNLEHSELELFRQLSSAGR